MTENKFWKTSVNFGGREVVGDRSGQEDYSLFRILKNGTELLVVLSDGMGGHTSGEVASKNTVTVFDSTFNSYPSDSVPTKLGAALQQANNNLGQLILNNQSLEGMGCTLIGAHISADGLRWISVGDSLLYLCRNGNLTQLNADHSMAPLIQELYKSGKISKEESLNHPNKNALRSAVMGSDIPMIDSPTSSLPLYHGDVLIVASDGLLTLSASQIIDIVENNKHQTADDISSALINGVIAKKKPRQDNTTVQVMLVPSSFAGQRKTLKGYLILFIAGLVLIALSVSAYFFNAAVIINKLFNVQTEHKLVPQPMPIPIPPQEVQPTSPQTIEPAKEAPKTTINSKKVSPKPDNGKLKPQKTPTDGDLKIGDSSPLKPTPDGIKSQSNSGLEGVTPGEDKDPAKTKPDPKILPPAKDSSDVEIKS